MNFIEIPVAIELQLQKRTGSTGKVGQALTVDPVFCVHQTSFEFR